MLRCRCFQAALQVFRSHWGCSEAPPQTLGDSKLEVTFQQKAVLSLIHHFPWDALCFPELLRGIRMLPKEGTVGTDCTLGKRCDSRTFMKLWQTLFPLV